MMTHHKFTQRNIYTLIEPSGNSLPFLIDSPHSGRIYPDDFAYSCDLKALQGAEDNHLDILLQHASDCGATYLQCEFPRSYIDVNRAESDIDSALLNAPYPHPINPTRRSGAGYGLVRRLVTPGMPLYSRLLDPAEIDFRIAHYYAPYHQALRETLAQLHYNFGQTWYIDMHSMPRTSAHNENGHPVDFVLGDRHGTTCRRDFIHHIQRFLEDLGYRVALNDPYKGVELVKRYSNPALNQNALQIEINKALYWDEDCHEVHDGAPRLHHHLRALFASIAAFIKKELVSIAAD